jgi:tetratricopeptide (TPR) repeat protein
MSGATPPAGAVPEGASVPVSVPGLMPAAGDRFSMAVYYHRAGDYDRALTEYEVLLRENDERADVHNNVGLIYQHKGDEAQATSHFRRAIAVAPRYVKAHNNLGVALLGAGNATAAASEFRVALSLDPRNLESLVNLALASRALGRPADARDLLRQALAIDPRNAGAHYKLGLVAEEGGDANLAITHYQLFLRFGALADADLVPKVRARLAELGGA